jgi:hypothetical protein
MKAYLCEWSKSNIGDNLFDGVEYLDDSSVLL